MMMYSYEWYSCCVVYDVRVVFMMHRVSYGFYDA